MKRIAVILICFIMILESIPAAAAEVRGNQALNAFVNVSVWDKNGNVLRVNTDSAKNVSDASDNSFFQTPVGTEKAEMIMDLYVPSYYNRITLGEAYSAVREFEIATSPDKTNWTTVYKGKAIGPSGKTVSFNRVNHRYIRLKITKTDNKFGDAIVSLTRWRVYLDNAVTKDDLNTAVYLAEIKRDFLKNSTLKDRIDDKVFDEYNDKIEKAKELAASETVSQEQLDSARDGLEAMTVAFETEIQYTDEDYEYIRKRLFNNYTGNLLEKNEERLNAIKTAGETAKGWRDKLLRNGKSAELWDDLIPAEANFALESAKLATAIIRIRNMAVAYKQEGNIFYNDKSMLDDVEYCLRFMLKKKYNRGIERYSNWYPWIVSFPTYAAEIMVLLRDDIPNDLITELRGAIEYYFPLDFYCGNEWTGANRLYLAAVCLKMGFALHDEFYVHRAVYSLLQECLYRELGVNDGDGYYWDGTYITHTNFMYNASYGRDWLFNSGNIISVLAGSPWQIEQAVLDDIAQRLTDGFEAIMYKGSTVDCAAGRGVGMGNRFGENVTYSMQQLAEYFSEPNRSKFLGIVKQFKIDQGHLDDPLVLNDEIEASGDTYRLKRFPTGDKFVGKFGDWGVALSMVSDRTKTFEASNGDAMKAWYASSGMLEILNDDRTQYDRNYWVSVDHYRLPGITVDLVPRTTKRFEGEMFNPNDWCASMDYDEKYGVAGMLTFNWNSSMSGKKSWFIFDNSVVALGSDIRGGAYEINTVIDNRKLKKDGSNKIYINSEEFSNDTDTVIENVKTAHVQGNTDKSDVGYYFPEPVSLTAVKEQRTEWEKDMWAAGADAYITENFAKLWLNHGVHPDNAKYAYVVLPGMTAQEVSEYKPDFEILSQDNTAHAVRNTRLSVAGYNFWQKTGGSVGGVSVSGQLILMTHDENGVFDISVSDPTFKATKPIVVTFADVNAESIISADSNVTVIDTKPLKISVNLKDINGRKITLSAAKEKTGNQ